MRRYAKPIVLTALLALFFHTPSLGASEETSALSGPPSFNVFESSAMAKALGHVFRQLNEGRFHEAEQAMREVTARFPGQPQNYYILTTILSVRGKKTEALAALSKAIDFGFQDAELLQRDTNLDAIRSESAFTDLVERILNRQSSPPDSRISKPVPAKIENGTALVTPGNTIWLPRFHNLLSQFDLPPDNRSPIVQRGDDPIARTLNRWFEDGRAAGNIGDLYDNRDHQHSTLLPDNFPQLTFVQYSEEAVAADIDYGLNDVILFNGVAIGNSSTAVTGGPFWRSQARLALTETSAVGSLFLQYIRNHLYIYPAVTDYDPQQGDILTANSPYMIVSLGKSGSDQPFLKAVASILAAFRPEVKAYLVANNLITPTVQMLFRAGQASIKNADDYLSYKAHPPVFDAANIDLARMIEGAQALKIPQIPPMVMLDVLKESEPLNGVDDFSRFRSETLHNTPGLITRAIRSTRYRKTMTVSALQTDIPAGQTLSYHWVVLRGDKDRIRIEPQKSDRSIVEISVPWHDAFPAPERPDLMTNRVEIGVFVHNGHHYSAPAFINFLYPANQSRSYDGAGRIISIEHDGPETAGNYIDPQVFARRHWRDDYQYDAEGNLTGWERSGHGYEEAFTQDGALIIERDASGRARKAEVIRYLLASDQEGLPVIRTQKTGQYLIYEYAGEGDRTGTSRPQ